MQRKFEDDFEDLILRSNYLVRMSKNDHSENLIKFKQNIKITSDLMYEKFIVNFEKAGCSSEDVFQLSNLYAHYYFDLYSAKSEKSYQDLADKVMSKYNRPLNDEDIYTYDRNGLITFLRQRITYIADLCNRKAENFLVGEDIVGFYAATATSKDVPDDVIALEHKKHGYRKIGPKELKAVKLLNKGKKIWKDADGFEIRKIEVFHQHLDPDNYAMMFFEDHEYTMSTEDIIIRRQEKEKADAVLYAFENKDVVDKIEYLKSFIAKNKSNKKKTTNVAGAKALMGMLRKQVERVPESIRPN